MRNIFLTWLKNPIRISTYHGNFDFCKEEWEFVRIQSTKFMFSCLTNSNWSVANWEGQQTLKGYKWVLVDHLNFVRYMTIKGTTVVQQWLNPFNFLWSKHFFLKGFLKLKVISALNKVTTILCKFQRFLDVFEDNKKKRFLTNFILEHWKILPKFPFVVVISKWSRNHKPLLRSV